MEAVFVHVITLESESLKTLTLITFLKLVSDITMLLKMYWWVIRCGFKYQRREQQEEVITFFWSRFFYSARVCYRDVKALLYMRILLIPNFPNGGDVRILPDRVDWRAFITRAGRYKLKRMYIVRFLKCVSSSLVCLK